MSTAHLLLVAVLCGVMATSLAQVSDECADKPTCLLTDSKCAKPVPSLTQCYKYNQQSCCVAGHDAVIKSAYDALWAPTCVREYSNLELLFCLGCNDDQGSFVDSTNKVVRVCTLYAESLFDATTTAGRTKYDNCGVLTGNDAVLLPGVAKVGGNYLINNATEFLNLEVGGNYPFRPPFFKDYEFKVVADNDPAGCFSGDAAATVVSMLVLALVALASGLLL